MSTIKYPTPVFLGDFKCSRDVFEQFDYHNNGENILFAAYFEDGGYDGKAVVIFEKDGKLFEVHGSHCSCYGLETQWDPEESSFEAIKKIMIETKKELDEDWAGTFAKEIVKPLAEWALSFELLNEYQCSAS